MSVFLSQWYQSLPSDQEVQGSILGSSLGAISSGEIFHYVFGGDVSVSFVHALPCVVFGRNSCNLLTTGEGRPSNCVSVLLYVVRRNFLHYRTLACKSLVTVEVQRKSKKEVAYVQATLATMIKLTFNRLR